MIRSSHDPTELDLDLICDFIMTSYWATGRTPERIRRSIRGSSVVGLYDGDTQLGFARAFSDGATMAYVMDLFVVEAARGQGLSLRLLRELMDHPDLRDVPVWRLSTQDAAGLYRKLGFERVADGTSMRFARDEVLDWRST